MKKTITIFIILTAFLFCCGKSGEVYSKEKTQQNKKSINQVQLLANNKLRYIELTGSAYERGLTHGKLLKQEIHELIRLLKDDIKKRTKQNPDEFIDKFLRLTDYKTSIEKRTPQLMDELKGISEGSETDFDMIFMHQLVDEYWFNAKDILAHKCTSFGVNKIAKYPSMTAQNMDIPSYYHGFQTVLKIDVPESDNDIMVLTIPGILGITGMNKNCVSINCNTLIQLKYSKSGLPVTFIVRGVVSKSTQKEALDFINEINHASGQNYVIGGPKQVYSLECSANEVHEFRPFENSIFTYHTNHPLRNKDFSGRFLSWLKRKGKTLEQRLSTCKRIGSMSRRFNEKTKSVSIKDIQEALSSRDHEGRDVVSNNSTYASVIYVLSEKPKFIIATGKPHETKYIEIKFE